MIRKYRWAIALATFILNAFHNQASAQLNFESKLPIIIITTAEPIVDEPKVLGRMQIIWNGEGEVNKPTDQANEYDGPIGIEGRGQTSQFLFPKIGYAIETIDSIGNDIDTSFLDFPTEEDWVLHGPFSDKTLLRNALAMHLGNAMGNYHSRTKHVELILNGSYHGIYLLMEKIKRDKSRIDIANLKAEDISGDELTGGYVFKVDKGDIDWFSQYRIWDRDQYTGFQYVSPNRNKIQTEQKEYIRRYVDSFERALYATNFIYKGKRYDDYINLTTFADHFILKEFAKDADAFRISSYYYKDKDSKGGKLSAGPAWDFNIAFGNINYCDGDNPRGWMYFRNCNEGIPFWWYRFIDDSVYRNKLKCRWKKFSSNVLSLDSIYTFIDDKVEELGSAVERNYERWPILDEYIWPNPEVTGSYLAEVENLKTFIAERWEWLDINMPGSCEVSQTDESINDYPDIIIYPNPAKDVLMVKSVDGSSISTIILNDQMGRIILEKKMEKKISTEIKVNIDKIPSGLYNLYVRGSKGSITKNVLIEN